MGFVVLPKLEVISGLGLLSRDYGHQYAPGLWL
jgi:hypothetical protein